MRRVRLERSILPGLRIIKTIIALAIVMVISVCTNGFLPPYEMAVVAILAMQDDVAESLKEVRNRLSSTIIGGLIGIISMVIGNMISQEALKLLFVPIGIFLILYFCSKLINKKEYIIIACYVFLSITLDKPVEVSFMYPIKIMLTTIVASVVAMAVNLYDPRKNKKVTLYKEKK